MSDFHVAIWPGWNSHNQGGMEKKDRNFTQSYSGRTQVHTETGCESK